jgi:hypothetical protein
MASEPPSPKPTMNASARNERRKITATYLNTIGSGVLLVGGFAPVVTFVYGTSATLPNPLTLVTGTLICIVVSLVLHFLARTMLKGIE